jgi:hypothetical protein
MRLGVYFRTNYSQRIGPEHGSADSDDIEADLQELFLAVGQAARSVQILLL